MKQCLTPLGFILISLPGNQIISKDQIPEEQTGEVLACREGRALVKLLYEWKELGGCTWGWIKVLCQVRQNIKLVRGEFIDMVAHMGFSILARTPG